MPGQRHALTYDDADDGQTNGNNNNNKLIGNNYCCRPKRKRPNSNSIALIKCL